MASDLTAAWKPWGELGGPSCANRGRAHVRVPHRPLLKAVPVRRRAVKKLSVEKCESENPAQFEKVFEVGG
jgi:hypothetical protein